MVIRLKPIKHSAFGPTDDETIKKLIDGEKLPAAAQRTRRDDY